MRGVVGELAKFYRMIGFDAKGYFVNPNSKGTKLERLFQRYMDLDAGNSDAVDWEDVSSSDKAFMMLRKELARRLYRYVLVMDPNKLSASKQHHKHFNILKNAIISRLLLFLGLYKSGLHLAKQTIKGAKEAEVWDVVFTLSSSLGSYYSLRGNARGFREFEELADIALNILSRERELKKMINKWSFLYGKRQKATKEEIQQLKFNSKVGDSLVRSEPTLNLLHLNYRLKLFYYDSIMDYEKAILVCKEAQERILEGKKDVDIGKLGIYHGTQMYCYLNLKKFTEARSFAENYDEYFLPGTLNWYITTEYYFVLCIQTNRYSSAYEQLQKALHNRTYGNLGGVRKQMWNLFEGYMQFVISGGLWADPPDQLEVRQFKVAKFLNEVISLSGDKAGIHVSVLILQIMFFLQQGRYEDIIDRKDALRRYVYRYLYSKENERSRIFLSMLLRMIECDFSYSITKTKTQRLYKSLTEQQMNYQANLGGNEIVDYEVLWNWTLDTIKGSLTWKLAAAAS